MVFASAIFLLIFLPSFLLVYQFAGKQLRNYVILLASIIFYSWGAPKFVWVILGSTILDFYLVRWMHHSPDQARRKLLLAGSIFMNLGLLIYFKYANFFIENVNATLHEIGYSKVKWTDVALPIGISFYTFQTLTYSIDIFRGKHKPLEKVSDYLLYIMSFPQMIAGPIVRFTSIADQITDRVDNVDDKLIGFYRFCIGLAKKVLIANVMAEQADAIFNSDLDNLNGAQAWLGTLAYTFQIYFDFAGYSDMAIGLGRMMAFRFPENFNSPYTATSISEFWRKWHITLGSFMRDYLYIPLGGNRVDSKGRLYANLWIVFLLSGLWHGASWNYVLWGAYHGMFLILDRIFLLKALEKAGKVVATLFTFLTVMFGWILFRLESFSDIQTFVPKLFDFSSVEARAVPAFTTMAIIGAFFAILTAFKPGQKLANFFFERDQYSIKQHGGLATISILLLFLSVSSIIASGFNPFIYFRF